MQLRLKKEGIERGMARMAVGKGVGRKEGIKQAGEVNQLGKVKVAECVVFVPATPGSRLRNIFQQRRTLKIGVKQQIIDNTRRS